MKAFLKRQCLSGLLPTLAVTIAASVAIAAQRPAADLADSDWQSFGRDGSEQHYAPIDQVNLQTVNRLGLAWQYQLPPGNSVTGPVQAEGKLFVISGHSHVYAFSADTGKLLWDFDSKAQDVEPLQTLPRFDPRIAPAAFLISARASGLSHG